MCQACAARFYDLSREPIVCPSCGAHYVPAPPAPEAHAGPFTAKTGWRRKAFRPDPEPDADDTAANDNATEETPSPGSDDEDVVLDEQEPDEAEVTALVDHRDAEPNER